MTEHESLVGKVVRGFRVEELLGQGGMGNVYLGRHETIGSKVAIKVLHPEYVSDSNMERRFLDEARAVNKVEHPGLVKISDCGQEDGVGVFLVMELLNGRTLRDKLKQDGPLPPPEVVRVVGHVASALEAVHRVGIIHRDLKPENLMLIRDPYVPNRERVKILDFGIAKLLEDGVRIGEATETGHIFGSPLYMSPEQCADTKSADHRTDIYALGVIAYELVCGSTPFVADSIYDLVRKHLTTQPPLPTSRSHQVPEAMGRVILKALAMEPEDRFQNVATFGAALEASLGQPASETLQWGAAAGPEDGARADVVDTTEGDDEQGFGLAPTMLAKEATSVGVITTEPPVKLKQTEERKAISGADTEMASPGVDSDSLTLHPAQDTLPVIGEVATVDVPPGAEKEGRQATEPELSQAAAGPADTVHPPVALPWHRRAAIPAGLALAGLVAVTLMLSLGDRREDPVIPEGRGAKTSGTTKPPPFSPAAGTSDVHEQVPAVAPDAAQHPTPAVKRARKKVRPGKRRAGKSRRPEKKPAGVTKPASPKKPGLAPVEKNKPNTAAAPSPAKRPGTDFRYRKLSPRSVKKETHTKGNKKGPNTGGLKKDLRYRRIKGGSDRKK